MTLAREVDCEKDVLKFSEAILCSTGFSKCNVCCYGNIVFDLVCSSVYFSVSWFIGVLVSILST